MTKGRAFWCPHCGDAVVQGDLVLYAPELVRRHLLKHEGDYESCERCMEMANEWHFCCEACWPEVCAQIEDAMQVKA